MKKRGIALLITACYVPAAAFFFQELCDYFFFVPGYQCSRVSPSDLFGYLILAWLPALFLPINGGKPSTIILWFSYYTNIVSTILLYPFLVTERGLAGWLWVLSVSLLFSAISVLSRSIVLTLPRYSISPKKFYILVIALITFFFFNIVAVFGFTFEPPSIDDVYGVRREFKRVAESSGSVIVGYLVVMGGFVLAPLALLMGVRCYQESKAKSAVLFLSSLLLSFGIYGAGGFKSVAFASFTTLLLYLVFAKVKNFAMTLAIGIPLLVFFIYASVKIFDFDIVFYHWFRRVFMVPGMNASYFFEYVSSRGIFGLAEAPSVISHYYFGTDGSANTGFFGDGFAKGQYLGLLFNAFLLIGMIILSDSLAKGVSSRLSICLFLPVAYAISNSALTSVFITYGFLLVLFLLFIGRRSLGETDSAFLKEAYGR